MVRCGVGKGSARFSTLMRMVCSCSQLFLQTDLLLDILCNNQVIICLSNNLTSLVKDDIQTFQYFQEFKQIRIEAAIKQTFTSNTKQETAEDKMRKLGQTPIFKLLLQQTIPNIVSLLSISMYQVVASIFVGQYIGEAGLAAQSVFSAVEYLTCTSLPVAFSIGAVSLISPALGQDKIPQAKIHLTQYLYLSLMYIVLVPLALLPWLDGFLKFLGASNADMLRLVHQYALCLLLLGPLVYTPNGGFLPLFRVENRATEAMVIQVTSSTLNLAIGAFVFPLFAKQLQLYAAAIATLSSLFITGVYTVLNFGGCVKRSVLRFVRCRIEWKTIATIIIQAMPQFLNALPNQVGVILANAMIKRHSNSTQQAQVLTASVGLFTQLGMLTLQPRQAVYLGFVPILGFNVGAKLHERVTRLLRSAFWLISLLVLSITALLILFAPQMASWFSSSQEYISVASRSFRMAIFGYPLGGSLMLCSGIYQMERKPLIASLFQGTRLVLCVGLLVAIPYFFPIEYIFLGFGLTDTISGVVGVIYFWVIYARYKKIECAAAVVVAKVQDSNELVVSSESVKREELLHGGDKEGKLEGDVPQ